MGRRYWLVVIALALVACVSEWLVWINRDRSDATFAGPPRSDYTLGDYTLNALDSTGKRTFKVSGPRLERRDGDGTIFLSTPDYALIDGSGNPWIGKSDAAWVNKDGSIMKLLGYVEMHRRPLGKDNPVDVITSELTTWPKAKRIETAAPATIIQPGSIINGVGMRGDFDTKTLELLSDVHSTLQPKQARAATP